MTDSWLQVGAPVRRKQPDGADLAIEVVSEGAEARERDLETKRAEYARAGISEYWIVDPQESRITVLTLDGQTSRIPCLGDLPILGPFFSNTTSSRIEKELIVLVTPYLVEPMHHDEVPPCPGDEINGPNDLEFYLDGRIEGQCGRDWRATTGHYTAPAAALPAFLRLQNEFLHGPHGYGD